MRTDLVPGIGNIAGDRASSHAMASCACGAPRRSAIAVSAGEPSTCPGEREREERQEREAVGGAEVDDRLLILHQHVRKAGEARLAGATL